jgi:hypothetical protein
VGPFARASEELLRIGSFVAPGFGRAKKLVTMKVLELDGEASTLTSSSCG